MPNKDPRVDAYIEKSADFAKPILTHLRKLVHKASPKLSETVKWGMPAFEYKGLVCGLAAFKEHCTFGFWKQSLLNYDGFSSEKTAMGSFGRHHVKEGLADRRHDHQTRATGRRAERKRCKSSKSETDGKERIGRARYT